MVMVPFAFIVSRGFHADNTWEQSGKASNQNVDMTTKLSFPSDKG